MLSVSLPSATPLHTPSQPSPVLCFALSFISDYNHHLLQVIENVVVWTKEMEIKGLDVTAGGVQTVTQLDPALR